MIHVPEIYLSEINISMMYTLYLHYLPRVLLYLNGQK